MTPSSKAAQKACRCRKRPSICLQTYALRHLAKLEAIFGRFQRVLKPSGRVLILETTRPADKFGPWLSNLYFGRINPFFVHLFTETNIAEEIMVYFWKTRHTCVRPESVLAAFRAAGLENAACRPVLDWFSEYTAIKA
ncbi:MAG: hypothetical protein RIS79_3650 [Verrucomicrobiota bacterium]